MLARRCTGDLRRPVFDECFKDLGLPEISAARFCRVFQGFAAPRPSPKPRNFLKIRDDFSQGILMSFYICKITFLLNFDPCLFCHQNSTLVLAWFRLASPGSAWPRLASPGFQRSSSIWTRNFPKIRDDFFTRDFDVILHMQNHFLLNFDPCPFFATKIPLWCSLASKSPLWCSWPRLSAPGM